MDEPNPTVRCYVGYLSPFRLSHSPPSSAATSQTNAAPSTTRDRRAPGCPTEHVVICARSFSVLFERERTRVVRTALAVVSVLPVRLFARADRCCLCEQARDGVTAGLSFRSRPDGAGLRAFGQVHCERIPIHLLVKRQHLDSHCLGLLLWLFAATSGSAKRQ